MRFSISSVDPEIVRRVSLEQLGTSVHIKVDGMVIASLRPDSCNADGGELFIYHTQTSKISVAVYDEALKMRLYRAPKE